MRRKALIATAVVLLLAAFLVGLPWFHAYHSYDSASGCFAVENNKAIHFVYVDKTHFDVYKTAFWLDDSLSILGRDGTIYCNGRPIDFPAGKNVALVRGPEEMTFIELGPKYFQADNGHSEVVYLLGKVPHFKEKSRGMIDLQKVKEDHAMREEWEAFLAIAQ